MTKTKKRPKRLKLTPTVKHKRIVKHRRPIHKRVLLHPVSILLLMCVGVLLIGSTLQGQAASNTTVSATVEAPELTVPAVITQPTDGTVFNAKPITVSGSCPDNSYVELSRNGQFSGVALCNNNVFRIQSDLFDGDNQLLAQDYNTTDEAGPLGSPINVTYNAPASLSTPSSSSAAGTSSTNQTSAGSSATAPPVMTSQFQYQATEAGQVFTTTINIDGGTPPYYVTVNWGDGTSTDYTFNSDPTFEISHTYLAAGNFVIIAKAVDAKGVKTTVQLVAIIHAPLNAKTKTPATGGTTGPTSPPAAISSFFRSVKHYLWVAWPSYLIVVALAFSFWLGEHEELRLLRRRKQSAHRS
jgi:hypothetical protein